MTDDTPTQRFDTPAGPPSPPAGLPPVEQKKSRGLLIALIAIGAIVLIALIILVIVLVRGGGGQSASSVNPLTTSTASASATPTETASAPSTTPTTNVTPSTKATSGSSGGSGGSGSGGGTAPTGGTFTVFQPVTNVKCSAGGPGFTPPPVPIQITWKAERSQSVWFVAGTSDAADSQYMKLPVSGNESDFPFEVDFPCGDTSRQATYNLTLVGDDGKHLIKTWTVKNTGEAP